MVCFGFDRGLRVLESREARAFTCPSYNIRHVKTTLTDHGNDRAVCFDTVYVDKNSSIKNVKYCLF